MKKIKLSTKIILAIILSVVIFGGLGNAVSAEGMSTLAAVSGLGGWGLSALGLDPGEIAVKLVLGVIKAYIQIIGYLMITIIGISISLFQYNNFVNATVVTVGWNLVRDITNMAFVIMFLVMAFYTVLGKGQYQASQFLVRLVIAAVAVNFSRTIAGLIIDASQVVMLTFVNGFQAVAGGNFVNAFGISKYMQVSSVVDEATSLGNHILAAILVTITLFVILSMVIMLAARIIVLWVLIILSPFAFVLSVVPGKFSSKAGEWWTYFINYNIAGPILAFFVWLTLYYMNYLNSGQFGAEGFKDVPTGDNPALSAAAQKDSLYGFIIATVMLLIGVKIAAGLNVVGANFAQKAVDFSKKKLSAAGKSIGRGAGGMALRGAGQATAGVRAGAGTFLAKIPGLQNFGLGMRRNALAGKTKDIEERKKKLEGASPDEALRAYQTAITPNQKSAAAQNILGKCTMKRTRQRPNLMIPRPRVCSLEPREAPWPWPVTSRRIRPPVYLGGIQMMLKMPILTNLERVNTMPPWRLRGRRDAIGCRFLVRKWQKLWKIMNKDLPANPKSKKPI